MNRWEVIQIPILFEDLAVTCQFLHQTLFQGKGGLQDMSCSLHRGENVIKKKIKEQLNAEKYLLKENEHKRIKANCHHFDASRKQKKDC